MSYIPDVEGIRAGAIGFRVDRAAAALPQSATGGIFTVAGGRVVVTSLIGVVTVALGATATNLNVVHTPTVGSVADLAAATVVTSDIVGTLYSLTGYPLDLLSANARTLINVPDAAHAALCERAMVLPAGTIGAKTDANDTGSVQWSVTWYPFDTGATLVAA